MKSSCATYISIESQKKTTTNDETEKGETIDASLFFRFLHMAATTPGVFKESFVQKTTDNVNEDEED